MQTIWEFPMKEIWNIFVVDMAPPRKLIFLSYPSETKLLEYMTELNDVTEKMPVAKAERTVYAGLMLGNLVQVSPTQIVMIGPNGLLSCTKPKIGEPVGQWPVSFRIAACVQFSSRLILLSDTGVAMCIELDVSSKAIVDRTVLLAKVNSEQVFLLLCKVV